MLKIALIGIGSMGKLHLKNILELQNKDVCKLELVCDIDQDKVNEICSDINVVPYYSLEKCLEAEFDAAIIATTSNTHYEIAKKLLMKKKHVLIEKPVVLNLAEADELKKIANENGVTISAGYTEIYNSIVTGVDKLVIDNGNPNYFDFYRIGQKTTKNDIKDIDSIQDLLTHDLAVLYSVIKVDKISNVSGLLKSYNKKSGKYDFSVVSFLCNDNIVVRFNADRTSSVKIRKFNMSNEDFFGEFDFMDQIVQVSTKGNIEAFGENVWYSTNKNSVKIRYANNPLKDEILDFINSIEYKIQSKTSLIWYDVTKTIEEIRKVIYSNR
ncbi:Gfo/Idh/MocA family oxidoreductase [Clostridium sp. CTA-7]